MDVLVQVLCLLLVAWLPGAALFRIPWAARTQREGLDAEERVYWSLILSLLLSLATVLALAAAGQYTFLRLLLVNGLTTALIAVAWRGRLRMPGAQRLSATALVPVALAIFCTIRFSPPAEYVLGGRDPGIYMNEGIQIAQRGALIIHDPQIAELPPFARELFAPRHYHPDGVPRTDYYGIRFMGFPVKDVETGAVVGQFPHLLPAAIAIGYGIDGLTGARRATLFCAVLGVLSVYFLGVRLFGRAAATAAALLLSLHVIQLWFARYPNAEVLMQALLGAALLANARAHVDDDRFFAPIAGAALGLLLFLRYDTVLAIGAICAAVLAGLFARHRVRWEFIAALGLTAALAAIYLLGPMRAYVELPLVWLASYPKLHAAAALAFVIVGGGLTVLAAQHRSLANVVRAALPSVLGTTLLAFGIYALLWRAPVHGQLAAHDAYALRTFAEVYVTLPAVLAAMLGFVVLARQQFWRDPAFFVTCLVFSLFLFYKLRIWPEHFWMARRFVPVILPGVCLLIGGLAFPAATRIGAAAIVRWTLGGVFVWLLASAYLRAASPVLDHTEYAGLIPRLETLAATIADDDLVIVEGRETGSDVHLIGLPLAYIYAKNVLIIQHVKPSKADLAAFLAWAQARYRRILFIGGGGIDLLSSSYSLTPLSSERFQVPEFERTADALPKISRHKEFEFGVYQFGPPHPVDPEAAFDLDIGTQDDLHVLRFHAKEQSERRTFRWTTARSFVTITSVAASASELTLVIGDGGRPAAAPPARVEVSLLDEPIGSITASGGFRPYVLPIPPDLARRAAASRQPVGLTLTTVTWSPANVLGSGDDRQLGVMLDRVTVK